MAQKSPVQGATVLTVEHLRKSKLIFLWLRYPVRRELETFFPEIHFNSKSIEQMRKWFSNFREFFYIQAEKIARQIGCTVPLISVDEILIHTDSSVMSVDFRKFFDPLTILEEFPAWFIASFQCCVRAFYEVITSDRDGQDGWKKPIYKMVANRDDHNVPDWIVNSSCVGRNLTEIVSLETNMSVLSVSPADDSNFSTTYCSVM